MSARAGWELRDRASGPPYWQRVVSPAPLAQRQATDFYAHVEACADCHSRTDGSACPEGTTLRRQERDAIRGPS